MKFPNHSNVSGVLFTTRVARIQQAVREAPILAEFFNADCVGTENIPATKYLKGRRKSTERLGITGLLLSQFGSERSPPRWLSNGVARNLEQLLQSMALVMLVCFTPGCATTAPAPDTHAELRRLVLQNAGAQGLTSPDGIHWQETSSNNIQVSTTPISVQSNDAIPTLSPSAIQLPFDVTPEIRAFAEDLVKHKYSPLDKIAALVHGIYSNAEFSEYYQRADTHTAAQTLALHHGNCFSFTNLFIASARAAGLNAFYLDATRAKSGLRMDGLRVISSGHIVAGIQWMDTIHVVDFSRLTKSDTFRFRRISDREATGLYFNNMGYEAMVQHRDGVPFFRAAVEIAPELRSPRFNLAAVYISQGRLDDAEGLLKSALKDNDESFVPFFSLGLIEMKRGHYPLAEDLFREAYHRRRDNPYLLVHLSMAYQLQGKNDKATRTFKKAVRLEKNIAARIKNPLQPI